MDGVGMHRRDTLSVKKVNVKPGYPKYISDIPVNIVAVKPLGYVRVSTPGQH